ncbi:hypothetical protein [Brytella acorum]|uniref:Uncharacterized protein n=1 Tax=Brytella acorum TaxID=2959299 RepID=A0AA35UHU5_9PROT|nr:hypothetical protein [Brytella acorum]CAI9120453.1 hypothetical protein LMG32879_001286 [Brytella acorum]
MDYTSAPNYVVDSQGRRQLADRDLLNNVPGTAAVVADMNGLINELMNLIKAGKLVGDAADDTLVLQAIENLIEAATENAVEQQIDATTIGVDRAGYSTAAQALAFHSTDGTWRYPVTSQPLSGQDRVLTLGFDTTAGLMQVQGLSGATRSFLPGSQISIVNGTATTLGNQKWQAFYVGFVSGSNAQITFPLGFSALPTVLLQPTSENNTNLAIMANPVEGTLTTGGIQVNINNAPGVASTDGCGLWVWAFGAV